MDPLRQHFQICVFERKYLCFISNYTKIPSLRSNWQSLGFLSTRQQSITKSLMKMIHESLGCNGLIYSETMSGFYLPLGKPSSHLPHWGVNAWGVQAGRLLTWQINGSCGGWFLRFHAIFALDLYGNVLPYDHLLSYYFTELIGQNDIWYAHASCCRAQLFHCVDLAWFNSSPLVPNMSVNWVSIGSDYGLSPIQRQAIIWTNAGLLSILETWEQT